MLRGMGDGIEDLVGQDGGHFQFAFMGHSCDVGGQQHPLIGLQELEEGDPPDKLEDWPGGKAKYQTYGGPDSGDGGYEDGATAKLGPSNLRHHEDGSVTIDGEEVDDPEEYKGEPIPGGPSDPDAPPDPAMIGQEKDDEDGERRP